MIYADDKFLENLANHEPPSLTPTDGYVDLIVLSDIHLGMDGPRPDTYPVAKANFAKQVDEFQKRYERLRERLEGGTSDLVIQCGDLVEGRALASWATNDPDTIYKDVFEDLVVEALQRARLNAKGVVSPLLCIPGNHDLYRGGARMDRHYGPEGELDTIGFVGAANPKGWHFYQHVARAFMDKKPPDDWVANTATPFRYPALSLSAVHGDTVGKGSPPASYLAVIGIDSNFAEYSYDGAENHGEVNPLQLESARRLIEKLAHQTCCDAPLHVILAVHHHVLPVENKRLGDQLRKDAQDQLRERNAATCLRGKSCLAPEVIEPSSICVDKWLTAQASVSSTLNAPALIQFCHDNRVSVLLHGHMHQEQVLWVGRQSFSNRKFDETLAVVACPSFKPGQTPNERRRMILGMLRLRLRPADNSVEIAYAGTDANGDPKAGLKAAVQVRAPLISASRISNGERLLYGRALQLIDAELKEPGIDQSQRDNLEAYKRRVHAMYDTFGYVPVSPQASDPVAPNDIGKFVLLPEVFPGAHQHQDKKYNFLLLGRRRGDRYEILLSKHTPVRDSRYGDWHTLLMPTFKKPNDVLERLGADIERQHENAISVAVARGVDAMTSRINKIIDDAGFVHAWENQAVQLAEPQTFVKISPTDGTVTRYDYILTSLLPLTTGCGSDGEKEPLTDAVDKLPRIVLDEASAQQEPAADAAPAIWIGALRQGGSGMRWEGPQAVSNRLAQVKVPNGLVWFPIATLNSKNEWEGCADGWRTCPSLVARNADVLTWVEQFVINYRSSKVPGFSIDLETNPKPASANDDVIKTEQDFPFDGEGEKLVDPRKYNAVPMGQRDKSLHAAMQNVCFEPTKDLGADDRVDKRWPYRARDIRRVVLRRDTASHGRSVIAVYSADDLPANVNQRWRSGEHIALPEKRLGVLRPVQRYVTRSGIIRAAEVNINVLAKMTDPWGYAIATPRQGGAVIAVTPPILEELAYEEYESDFEGAPPEREFVLCDGNHRVIEQVWGLRPECGARTSKLERRKEYYPMCAVAVMGRPQEPYYAQPFSRFEWRITASNQHEFPPDLASKYSVREVPPEVENSHFKDAYRRYYRRLDLGFGYLGGQAGKLG